MSAAVQRALNAKAAMVVASRLEDAFLGLIAKFQPALTKWFASADAAKLTKSMRLTRTESKVLAWCVQLAKADLAGGTYVIPKKRKRGAK